MFDLLKQLCEINGTSGDEDRVAGFITEQTDLYSKQNSLGMVIQRDNLGNVLVFKKGKNTPPKTVMFAAHMDEVGFIITDITKEGFLRFAPVGGINAGAVFGRRVVFNNGIIGVIAGKPVHLLSQEEKDKQPKIDDLLIDIGAESQDKAEVHIALGDYCYFMGEYDEIGEQCLRSKAIDDRLGCAIMLDILKQELEYDCVFAFTVQEEIGCRGAGSAAFTLEPNICVVLEATTACDMPGISNEDRVCELGLGPVISFMDKGASYDRQLCSVAIETAKENDIKTQTKNKVVGGNDASVIHKSAGGIRTIAVSAPCRYLHTPHCMVNKMDIIQMRSLAERLLCKFAVL